MNRDNDMADTIQPYSPDALAEFQRGKIVATSVCRFANEFATQLANANLPFTEWQVWAGPGMTYWYCFRHRPS